MAEVDEPTGAEEEPAAPAEESPEEHILRAMDVAESGDAGGDSAAEGAESEEGGEEPAAEGQ